MGVSTFEGLLDVGCLQTAVGATRRGAKGAKKCWSIKFDR